MKIKKIDTAFYNLIQAGELKDFFLLKSNEFVVIKIVEAFLNCKSVKKL
jgi:hypothetical protein